MTSLRVQPGDWQYVTGQGILFLFLIYPSETRKSSCSIHKSVLLLGCHLSLPTAWYTGSLGLKDNLSVSKLEHPLLTEPAVLQFHINMPKEIPWINPFYFKIQKDQDQLFYF